MASSTTALSQQPDGQPVNVAHNPETDVTLRDVDQLFGWFARRWGAGQEKPGERLEWWSSGLWSMRPDHLKAGCEAVKNMPARPTLRQFMRACITLDPHWRAPSDSVDAAVWPAKGRRR